MFWKNRALKVKWERSRDLGSINRAFRGNWYRKTYMDLFAVAIFDTILLNCTWNFISDQSLYPRICSDFVDEFPVPKKNLGPKFLFLSRRKEFHFYRHSRLISFALYIYLLFPIFQNHIFSVRRHCFFWNGKLCHQHTELCRKFPCTFFSKIVFVQKKTSSPKTVPWGTSVNCFQLFWVTKTCPNTLLSVFKKSKKSINCLFWKSVRFNQIEKNFVRSWIKCFSSVKTDQWKQQLKF